MDDETTELSSEEITDENDILSRIKRAVKGWFKRIKECESSIPHLPRNEYDILFTLFNKTNPLALGRECVIENLEKTSESICQGHRDLDTLAQKFRGYDERTRRIEAAYNIALRQEQDYRNNLLRYSSSLEREARRTKLGNYVEGELEALADAFRYESELSCRSRYYDSRSRRN